MVRAEGGYRMGNRFAQKGFNGGIINGFGENIVGEIRGIRWRDRE